MEELQQTWMIIFNLCLILGTNLLMRPIINIVKDNPGNSVIKYYDYYGVAMILFFSLFSFWGLDWFHYLESFENVKITSDSDFFEDVYIFIINYLSPYYIFFRLWVWGLATVFLVLTFRRTNIQFTVAIFIFATTWLLWFSYARASLAFAILYFGASLMVNNNYGQKKFALGCIFVLLAFAFHKSTIFGIAIVLLAYFFYDKKLVFKAIPLYGVIAVVGFIALIMNSLDSIALYTENERMDVIASVGQIYMDDVENNGEKNFGVKLMILFERLPYYMMAIMAFFIVFGKYKDDTPHTIRFFAYILFLEVLYASAFALDYGFNTQTFYGRFLRFTSIPATIVLTYMYTEKRIFWLVRYTYLIAFGGVLYNLLYITISTL